MFTTPMVIVVAVNDAEPDYICSYGPFDSTTDASDWINARLDHGRFNYRAMDLRNPAEQ